MKLILGGAYQGKLTWAVNAYNLKEEDLWDLRNGLPNAPVRCLYHLEALTLAAAREGGTAEGVLAALRPCLGAESVVIAREVGSGVVPMEAEIRLWRELHGSVIKTLAREADCVTRLFCGLPEVLK